VFVIRTEFNKFCLFKKVVLESFLSISFSCVQSLNKSRSTRRESGSDVNNSSINPYSKHIDKGEYFKFTVIDLFASFLSKTYLLCIRFRVAFVQILNVPSSALFEVIGVV
jgi:hypothetical protein